MSSRKVIIMSKSKKNKKHNSNRITRLNEKRKSLKDERINNFKKVMGDIPFTYSDDYFVFSMHGEMHMISSHSFETKYVENGELEKCIANPEYHHYE